MKFMRAMSKLLRETLLAVFICVLMVTVNSESRAEQNNFEKKEIKNSNIPVKYIIKDGVAQGRLYLPAKCERVTQFAAQELQEYLNKITGTRLPLAWRNHELRHKKDIGIQLVVRDTSEWKGKESAQAFTIEETLEPEMITITGNTDMAVLYGVYQYLQELGVRWFSPGEIGENVPKLKDIAINKRKKSYEPSFLSRGLDFSGVHKDIFDYSNEKIYRELIHYEYDLWLLRNRLMFQRSIHNAHWFDFNTIPVSGGHGIKKAALDGVDIKIEPERFAMVTRDGKKERCLKDSQICFTNEKNIQQCVKSAVEFFKKQDETQGERNADLDEAADSFPMGLSDTSGICECENCTKVSGNPPYGRDRLVWSFYNRVARGLNEQMPGKKIGLFAPYYELTRPPDDVKIEPNIVAVSCRGTGWSNAPEDNPYYPMTKNYMENIKATRKAGAEMRNYDYVMWDGTPQPLNILDAAETYKEMGYKHYHAEVMTRNEQVWPILWTLAQYTWDSNRKTDKLLAEYCNEYYGNEGVLVLDLLKRIDANSRKIPSVVYGGFPDTQIVMSDDLIAYGRKKLEEAVKNVKGVEKARLESFYSTFEMFARTAETYRSYCEALNTRTPEAIADSQKKFADYEQFWETRKLQATCSPKTLTRMQRMSKVKIPSETEPKGRKELEDKKVWLSELFAFGSVPENIPNMFPLPEVWKFKIDHNEKGLLEGWEKVDYDDSKGWHPLSTWNFFERQGYEDIGGHFWYRLNVKVPVFPSDRKIFLRIGSLDDCGDIYINGKLAHSRKLENPDDWQASFAFDVTPFIMQGKENIIAVRGYDSTGAGGIWRPSALYTE